jgi:hypothetical protein
MIIYSLPMLYSVCEIAGMHTNNFQVPVKGVAKRGREKGQRKGVGKKGGESAVKGQNPFLALRTTLARIT